MTAIRNKLTIYFSVLVGCIFHQNLVKLVKSTIESFYNIENHMHAYINL
jgi:hypothetical protein